MDSNSWLDFFLRLTIIFHQPCIGGYSSAYFCACYYDLFAIVCVVECVPSRQHTKCSRWRFGQIFADLEIPVVLRDKLRIQQTWLRLECLTCWKNQMCG